jgi:hypothetical protein
MWHDLTTDSAVKQRGWFSAAALQQARQRSQTGRADLYMLQWAVLTLELWARQFIDRNPVEEIVNAPIRQDPAPAHKAATPTTL